MKAVFEIKTIENDWRPPFNKNTDLKEFHVTENDEFDRITGNGNDEAVFQLLQIAGDKAKIRYSRLFTPKEFTEGMGKDKTILMGKNHEFTLTYLWGEKGVTKKIVYMGILSQDEEPSPETTTQ